MTLRQVKFVVVKRNLSQRKAKIFVTQNFSDIFASSNTCRFDAQGHISRQP